MALIWSFNINLVRCDAAALPMGLVPSNCLFFVSFGFRYRQDRLHTVLFSTNGCERRSSRRAKKNSELWVISCIVRDYYWKNTWFNTVAVTMAISLIWHAFFVCVLVFYVLLTAEPTVHLWVVKITLRAVWLPEQPHHHQQFNQQKEKNWVKQIRLSVSFSRPVALMFLFFWAQQQKRRMICKAYRQYAKMKRKKINQT